MPGWLVYNEVMSELKVAQNREEWDRFVDEANGHALQTWGWGEVKAKHGWRAERIFVEQGGEVLGGAQILRRKLPLFGAMLYVPRGPVVKDEKNREAVLAGLAEWAEKYRGQAVCLNVEPDWREMPKKSGKWRKSRNRILLAETTVVDLTRDAEKLLAEMPKKRRQDIKKYLKSGLKLEKVEKKADFLGALEIYKEIGRRAKFNLHEDSYYVDIWQEMGAHQWLGVVKNEKKEVIAFQWALLAGENGFALFAGVGEEGRRRRINAGVKWECMGILREMGIKNYDFNGLLNDGINEYKLAFGGEEVRLCGAWELPLSSLYAVYSKILPAGKKITQILEKVR